MKEKEPCCFYLSPHPFHLCFSDGRGRVYMTWISDFHKAKPKNKNTSPAVQVEVVGAVLVEVLKLAALCGRLLVLHRDLKHSDRILRSLFQFFKTKGGRSNLTSFHRLTSRGRSERQRDDRCLVRLFGEADFKKIAFIIFQPLHLWTRTN